MNGKVWFSIASDILINLAAGWIGAVLIVPNFSKEKGKQKLFMLTMDIIFAIFCIVGAYLFRII